MRFYHPSKAIMPRAGDKRTVRRFCWLPVRLGSETAWLGNAWIVQVYVRHTCGEMRVMCGDGYWLDEAFAPGPNCYRDDQTR